MISKWLFSGAVVFELGSWTALLDDMSIEVATLLFVSAHGVSIASPRSPCRALRCTAFGTTAHALLSLREQPYRL